MNKYLKVLLILFLIGLVSVALFYGSLIFMFIYIDQAQYYSESTNLGSSEYYAHAISNAREAGYSYNVDDGPEGVHPGSIEGLDPRLGSDYLVNSLDIYYSNSSWLSVSFSNNGDSSFSFKSEDSLAKYWPENLPEREWVVKKFKIMFGMDDTEIEAYLPAENWEANDIFFEQVTVTKHPDFAAIRRHLLKESTNSTFDAETSGGMGGCSETFYNDSKKIGSINYFVPSAKISRREGWRTYTIHIDSLGSLFLDVSLGPNSSGETIPEEEYRAVFKSMFTDLGLPPEKVDDLKFERSGGVW